MDDYCTHYTPDATESSYTPISDDLRVAHAQVVKVVEKMAKKRKSKQRAMTSPQPPRTLQFTVLTNPLPKQSMRISGKGGYTAPRIKRYQQTVSSAARLHKAKHFGKASLQVEIWFYRQTKHRVDCDNLAKPVMDACNGVLWHDDNQVVDLILHKRHDKVNPRVVVTISEADISKEQAA